MFLRFIPITALCSYLSIKVECIGDHTQDFAEKTNTTKSAVKHALHAGALCQGNQVDELKVSKKTAINA